MRRTAVFLILAMFCSPARGQDLNYGLAAALIEASHGNEFYRFSGANIGRYRDGSLILTVTHQWLTPAVKSISVDIGGKILPGTVVASDKDLDLAVIHIPRADLVSFPIADKNPAVGEVVHVVGFPNGKQMRRRSLKVQGFVGFQGAGAMTDIELEPPGSIRGESGGGGFVDGKLVGVMATGDSQSQLIGVPTIREFLNAKVRAYTKATTRNQLTAFSDRRPKATSPRPYLLAFTATWCQPCREMKPILASLQRSGHDVRLVDVDRSPQTAQRYGIRSLPTFIVQHGKKTHGKIVGKTSRARLVRLLRCHRKTGGDVPPPTEPHPPHPPAAQMPQIGGVTIEDLPPDGTPYGRWKPVGNVYNLELGVVRGHDGSDGEDGEDGEDGKLELWAIINRLDALEGAEFTVIIQDKNGVEWKRMQVKAKGGVLPLKFGSFDAEKN